MRNIDFKNKSTKILNDKLLLLNKENYEKYLFNSISAIFDGGNNEIYKNAKINFDCFQMIEVYSRSNREKIENIFTKLIALSNDNDRYINLKNIAEENIYKIIERTDYSYIALLSEFKLNCNLKYISYINITLDCMGPNLFKLIFNCELTDLAKYKYWLYACPNVLTELEIKKYFHIGKYKINLSKTTGNQRKRSMLKKHTHNIYKEINKYLATIAPGIFTNIYRKIPCTISAIFDIIPEYIITKDYVVLNQLQRTDFINDITSFNGQCESYTDIESRNVFISIKNDFIQSDDILMKYFRTNQLLPADIAWYNIIYLILNEQSKLIEMLKNEQYENDIFGKTIKIKEYKKKMQKIEPLLNIIKSSYSSDKFSFKDYYEKYNNYINEYNKDNIIKFYDEYKKRIDYLIKSIEKEVISIKEIYSSNYIEINTKINRKLQWIAIFIALMTFFQAFMQCQEKKVLQNKDIENIPKIEKEIEEKSMVCQD